MLPTTGAHADRAKETHAAPAQASSSFIGGGGGGRGGRQRGSLLRRGRHVFALIVAVRLRLTRAQLLHHLVGAAAKLVVVIAAVVGGGGRGVVARRIVAVVVAVISVRELTAVSMRAMCVLSAHLQGDARCAPASPGRQPCGDAPPASDS